MTATKPTKKRAPRRRKATAEQARAALGDQPLVSLVGAAKLMGIKPPNVSRLRAQGRMPEGIEVEGSAMVYLRSEVLKLAGELEKERSDR